MDDEIQALLSRLSLRPAPWVDGAWAEAGSGAEAFAVRNPATGLEIAHVPLAVPGDFQKAIDGAQRAF
jgi:acyl-CoA reductase-like NAD-dependent aldehyde dehydrogenase